MVAFDLEKVDVFTSLLTGCLFEMLAFTCLIHTVIAVGMSFCECEMRT